jgi:molybdopterin synthase sulfur carrier subunit
MKVNFFATLRQVVGTKTVEIPLGESASVRQLIRELILRYPGLEAQLLDEQGELRQHVRIIVNGRDALFLENALETHVSPNDTISIFPAIGGGAIF